MMRFIVGLAVGMMLGQLAQMDTTPIILVILSYFIGVLHMKVLKKMEVTNAKK